MTPEEHVELQRQALAPHAHHMHVTADGTRVSRAERLAAGLPVPLVRAE